MNALALFLPIVPFLAAIVFALCLNLAFATVRNFLRSGGFFSYVHFTPAAFPKPRLRALGGMPS